MTVQVEEKEGSLKLKKKISHREVFTQFPQTEQVDGKEGTKHKKNKSDKESFSEST